MASSSSACYWAWNQNPGSSVRHSLFCSPSSSPSPNLKSRSHLTHISSETLPSSSERGLSRIIIDSLKKPNSDYPNRNRSGDPSTQRGRLPDFVHGCSDDGKLDVAPKMPKMRRFRMVGLKLLFGKRHLWKRIFFASKKIRSIMLLNVITVIYASEIPVIKEVEDIMDPALFTCIRFVIAAIPFLPFIFQTRKDGHIRAAGLELGFWVSLGYLAQALGLLTSDAGRASFVSAFTAITVPLIEGMLGAKVPRLTWLGASLSFIGVAMLESSGSPPNIGDILNILSAVFFGIHMLRTEHISRVTDKENYIGLLGYQVCIVALFSIVWYLSMGGYTDLQELSSESWQWSVIWNWVVSFPWIPALYTGVFSTGLCLWMEMNAMCNVSATEAAIVYGLEPIWGAAFAWFLLDERWGTTGWVGAALVLGGSLTVQIWGSSPAGKSGTHEVSCEPIKVLDEQEFFSVSRGEKHAPNLSNKSPFTGSMPNKTRKKS